MLLESAAVQPYSQKIQRNALAYFGPMAKNDEKKFINFAPDGGQAFFRWDQPREKTASNRIQPSEVKFEKHFSSDSQSGMIETHRNPKFCLVSKIFVLA